MTDAPTSPRPAERPASQRTLRALRTTVLVLVIFLVAAVVVWILGGSGEGEGEEEAAAPAVPGAPRIVSAAELREAAAGRKAPLYWAGERPGAELELSEAPAGGRAYVRYLTGGAQAGDPKPAYLAIGTYALPHAYRDLKASAKGAAGKLRQAPHGFSAWRDPSNPRSVYLAKPGAEYQVEVYDPSPKTALEVALSGAVRPVTP